MQIRIATLKDLPHLRELIPLSVRALSSEFYTAAQIESAITHVFGPDTRLIEDGTYFVVEQAGAIIGAGGWTTAAPGRGQVRSGQGNIRHVVTDDRQVRRGVGRALMTHIVQTATAAGVRRLECLSTLTARPFYQAMGFVVAGPVTVPLAQGIEFPAIAMWRDL